MLKIKSKISKTYHRIITRALLGDTKFRSYRCHICVTFERSIDIDGTDCMVMPRKRIDVIALPCVNAVSIGVSLDSVTFDENPTFENIAKRLFNNIRKQTTLIKTLRMRVYENTCKEITDYEISH